LMFKVVDEVARVLKDEFDVEIIEAHHRMKKDAPSGTAVRLAQIVAEGTEQDLGKMGVYGRKGIVGERRPGEIGVHAVRAGDIVGEHTVLFAGPGERFEITHRAHSRDTFAGGAVRAALWIAEQPPGSYSMEDVLGI
ncbi:MAG: 4-hydroxy-tetrahydrodipicolinate reductase, partial [Proteobacteria bacterium]|nr:4-hydroxy-tetrahydrodipicolinate reductase [Pseudomonadota bacterium]